MHVGVPKEIKVHEYRVGLTPAGARELVARGHSVLVETGAGAAIGLDDEQYRRAGADIVADAATLFARAELVVKVKEPQPSELKLLRPEQLLFAYLHLAPDPEQARGLIASGATAIAYETVVDRTGALPLLAPMSEVAGRMAVQAAAHQLEKAQGGRGVLLGGVPGVERGHVVVLGGGVVGLNAARMAVGLGARVTLLDRSLPRLKQIDELCGASIATLFSTTDAIEQLLPSADAVIGAVLIPGAAAPKLITRDMLKLLRPGSVLVDVAIDQGGCFESSRPTTHQAPTYVEQGVIHYCVANMPGAVARTSTFALTNATLPYVLQLADRGSAALESDAGFLAGLNICRGAVTCKPVAEALQLPFVEPLSLLNGSFAAE